MLFRSLRCAYLNGIFQITGEVLLSHCGVLDVDKQYFLFFKKGER